MNAKTTGQPIRHDGPAPEKMPCSLVNPLPTDEARVNETSPFAGTFRVPTSLSFGVSVLANKLMLHPFVEVAYQGAARDPDSFHSREKLVAHVGMRLRQEDESFERLSEQDVVHAVAALWHRAGRDLAGLSEAHVIGLLGRAAWEANFDPEALSGHADAIPRTDYDADADEAGAKPCPPIDLKAASVGRFLGADVPKIPWLLEGVLPLGMPAALSAAPGVGKSFWLLLAGMSVATGLDLLPGFKVAAPGRVFLVFAEEPEVVIHARLAALVEELIAEREDAVEVLARLKANLFILAREGEDNRLVRPGARRGEIEETPFTGALRRAIASPDLAGLKLLGLDPWSQLAPQAETDPAESTAAVGVLAGLGKASGACVLTAVHVRKRPNGKSKPSTFDLTDPDEIRGSSAFLGAVRTVIALACVQEHEAGKLASDPAKPHDTILTRVAKANHGGKRPPFFMVRGEGGVLRYWRDMHDRDVVSDDEADLHALSEVKRILRQENEKPIPRRWTVREFFRTHAKSIHWRGKPMSQAGLERLLKQAVHRGLLLVTDEANPKLILPPEDPERAEVVYDVFAPGRECA